MNYESMNYESNLIFKKKEKINKKKKKERV